jgi:hypothetical protein
MYLACIIRSRLNYRMDHGSLVETCIVSESAANRTLGGIELSALRMVKQSGSVPVIQIGCARQFVVRSRLGTSSRGDGPSL